MQLQSWIARKSGESPRLQYTLNSAPTPPSDANDWTMVRWYTPWIASKNGALGSFSPLLAKQQEQKAEDLKKVGGPRKLTTQTTNQDAAKRIR